MPLMSSNASPLESTTAAAFGVSMPNLNLEIVTHVLEAVTASELATLTDSQLNNFDCAVFNLASGVEALMRSRGMEPCRDWERELDLHKCGGGTGRNRQ